MVAVDAVACRCGGSVAAQLLPAVGVATSAGTFVWRRPWAKAAHAFGARLSGRRLELAAEVEREACPGPADERGDLDAGVSSKVGDGSKPEWKTRRKKRMEKAPFHSPFPLAVPLR